VGSDFPAIKDVQKYVIGKPGSQTDAKTVGENYYNRGIMNAVVITEAIRNAQKITGKKDITGDEMRRGLESLQVTAARWKELGLDGFAAPFQVTCDDHNGHNSAYVQQWDGAKWVKVSDWIAPMKDKVMPLMNKAAEDYVTKNAGWPKSTEACDKSS
jgi:branched-chain amino acid transport system substrate-binding protein